MVGPICETADFFAQDRALPPVKLDDIIAILTAGAYGFSMSSNYNIRPRTADLSGVVPVPFIGTKPEVLVDGSNFSVIRKRETYNDLISLET